MCPEATNGPGTGASEEAEVPKTTGGQMMWALIKLQELWLSFNTYDHGWS